MNKKILFLILILINFLIANEEINLFSPTKKSILETQKKIIDEEKKLNEKSWLSDININSNSTKDDDGDASNSLSLSYEQDIFKFGAIYETINLAKLQKEYDLLDLELTFTEYLNEIYSNTINVKLTDLSIQKQKLSILNKQITLSLLKSEYSAGEIGVSDLNDAIMEKNSLEEDLVDLEKTKKQYLLSLNQYTNLDYKDIEIPKLKIQKLEEYVNSSRDIKLTKYNEQIAKSSYKVKKSDYLPSLAFSSNYNKDFLDEKEESYSYGLKLSIPISFSSLNDIEKYRLEYLLSKDEKEQKIIDKSLEYKKLIQNIEALKSSNLIAEKDIDLYKQLLQTVQDEYIAGYKAIEDVQILSNTKKMRELDLKINNLSVKLELITMYY